MLFERIIKFLDEELERRAKDNDIRYEEALYMSIVIKGMIEEAQSALDKSVSEFYQPLTLTEAILHAENVAYGYDGTHDDMCADCKKQHEQLAMWLKKLRDYRVQERENEALNS